MANTVLIQHHAMPILGLFSGHSGQGTLKSPAGAKISVKPGQRCQARKVHNAMEIAKGSMDITDWWFGTWLLFSTIYGMSSFPLTNSYFQDGFLTTNQIMINREIHLDYLDPPKTPKWDLLSREQTYPLFLWKIFFLDTLAAVNIGYDKCPILETC